ncbi:hypothetical protein BY458DRAFT_557167 [Sporodiniella umbellata]|nr:hypothetical protein BY458DRAFT_557167 [Sporodiniella umbellata]
MGLIDKIKSNVEVWKVGKYTKRRSAQAQDFVPKDKDFYLQNYKDGEYFHRQDTRRQTSIIHKKGIKHLRSSEHYNNS